MTGEGIGKGRVCLITGATNGVGRAAARRIAQEGFHMVLVGRDDQRGAATVEEVRLESGNDDVVFMRADLSIMAEVEDLAAGFREGHDRLDLLVNNAGAIFQTRETTKEGLEKTLALNHLAYFLLTVRLMDLLEESAPARIVNVSSGAHRAARIYFDDLNLETGYGTFRAYGQSKLANILFTKELARRLKGKGVTANCLHPGFVASGFASNNGGFARTLMSILSPFARTPMKGAETLLHLALSPAVSEVTGEYFHDLGPARISKAASSPEDAARLWEESEHLVEAVLGGKQAARQGAGSAA